MDIVELLIKSGVSPDSKDNLDNPLFIIAYTLNDKEKMSKLVELGADVNILTSGMTALIMASKYGLEDMVDFLLKNEADPNIKNTIDGSTALIEASKQGNVNIIYSLLENGADVNITDNKGFNALSFAKKGNKEGIISILESYGAQ